MEFIPPKFWGFKTNITSKYEWEINYYIEGYGFPVFTAKRKDSKENYYCSLIHKDNKESCLKVFKECKKYSSLMEIKDIISIDDITYVFFEAGQFGKIDEKKLLEMFIELNEINTSENTEIIIYYFINSIVFKNNKYKIYPFPSAVYEKNHGRSDVELIGSMVLIFKGFGLSLTDKIKEIQHSIIEMQKQKKPRRGYL